MWKQGLASKKIISAEEVPPRCFVSWHNECNLPTNQIHGKLTGHVQSKCHPKGVTLTLHGTYCVHTTVNLRKMKLISYIYTCFYIVFVHYLWNFVLNLANKWRRKVIIRRVWLLRSTAVTMTWRQSNVTSANQLLRLSMTSLTRNVAWTSVVHECMNLVGPK